MNQRPLMRGMDVAQTRPRHLAPGPGCLGACGAVSGGRCLGKRSLAPCTRQSQPLSHASLTEVAPDYRHVPNNV